MKVSLHSAQAATKPRRWRSRSTCRLQSNLPTMKTPLFEERTVFKVGSPARVERVGVAPDFEMPTDSDIRWSHQLPPDRFSVRHPLWSKRGRGSTLDNLHDRLRSCVNGVEARHLTTSMIAFGHGCDLSDYVGGKLGRGAGSALRFSP